MTKEKIGIGIVTCNRPDFLRNLLDSLIPCHDTIDEMIIVNDGIPVTGFNLSQGIWLDNPTNLGVGKSKNKAMSYLLYKKCDYIFLIEDDMMIIDPNIFRKYIEAYKKTGIHHMMFAYHGPANKAGISKGRPVPRTVIDYGTVQISLNQHCVGAFCFYTRECLEKVGINDEKYLNAFEHVDHSYRLAKAGYSTPYWWWADIANSLDYIQEQSCSEESSSIKTPEKMQQWSNNIQNSMKHFKSKFGVYPFGTDGVQDTNFEDVAKFLKQKKNENKFK